MKKSEETKIETILEKEEEGEFIHELTSGKVYEQSKEVYSNNFSTAVTFIFFSIIGLLVLVLNDLKVFKFLNVSGAQGIVTHLSFIIVFGICLIIGLKSLKIANKAKKNIESEEKNGNEINEFLKNNYSIELIDKECDFAPDYAEEMRYFDRANFLKNKIKEEFPSASDEEIDYIIDQYLNQDTDESSQA